MKISSRELNAIISESIQRHLPQMISEGMFDSMTIHEADNAENDAEKNTNSGNRVSKKRQRVISYLKQEGVDVAPYAYQLWPDKDEDSCRSFFYKCLNGEKDDSGVPYKFDDSDVNKLYTMISNNSI